MTSISGVDGIVLILSTYPKRDIKVEDLVFPPEFQAPKVIFNYLV